MLGLSINEVKLNVGTNAGAFSVSIPFKAGLNVLRAENSSGKSTCVNAIAYALGLEPILGPGRKRPFTKALYEEIYASKDDDTPYFVSSSYVELSVKNHKGAAARITRDIRGNDKKVEVSSSGGSKDYFLGTSGNEGSAKSERGFHNWLASFLGWELPRVVGFDGFEKQLYLECIFPLFFIEQKRGWSEIQANTPTTYGIRNVKRSATEFCLGIDGFEHEKKVATLRNKIEEAEKSWDVLRSSLTSVAEISELQIESLPDLGRQDAVYRIEFSFLENEEYITLTEKKRLLQRQIVDLDSAVTDREPSHDHLSSELAQQRRLQRKVERNERQIEQILISLSELDSKLQILRRDYSQYQQLKRLRSVGSDISLDLDMKQCPICESDLYDTLGNRNVKREPMSLDENISFLKNQLDLFGSISRRSRSDLETQRAEQKTLRSRLNLQRERVSDLKKDIADVHGGTKALLRQKVEAEFELRELRALEVKRDEFEDEAKGILTRWQAAQGALKIARSKATSGDREKVVGHIESILRANLLDFDFNQSAVGSVSVSRNTLRPEQEGYDIVAETSASDYIRVIWSYTLALLEYAGMTDTARHSGFVVFDEPRQHEASKVSFASLIAKAAESIEYDGQVIFATSLEPDELRAASKDQNVNIVMFDDYILSLEEQF